MYQIRLREYYPLCPDFPVLFGSLNISFAGPYPGSKLPVWPLPRSLAATWRIDVSFSSCGYLDVSVPRVPSVMTTLLIMLYQSISSDGFPHSEICALTDICSYTQLIAACHVLLRLPVPRHPPDALFAWPFDAIHGAHVWTLLENYLSLETFLDFDRFLWFLGLKS
jgi:hypothetical protein